MHERRHDLDWLRVFAIVILHFFHSAMPFVTEDSWHIKNQELSPLLFEVNDFLSRWRMPLLFLISGVGTMSVLGQRSIGEYVWQRFKRLVIPLVFGMLVVVPPQIYIERLAAGQAPAWYIDFYPSVLAFKPYPEGNFSWHHLWFVCYLWVYSVVTLPLLGWLGGKHGKRWIGLLSGWSHRFQHMYWPWLLVYGSYLLYFAWPKETHALIGDWAALARYWSFFLIGCLIGMQEDFWAVITARRKQHMAVAFFSLLLINYLRWNKLEPAWEITPGQVAFLGLKSLCAWTTVLAVLGYGSRYLRFDHPILAYTNEGIYPFYILHQTVIVVVGYYVIQTQETVISKYIFLSVISLLITLGLYEFGVRPWNWMRFLFGMKVRNRPSTTQGDHVRRG